MYSDHLSVYIPTDRLSYFTGFFQPVLLSCKYGVLVKGHHGPEWLRLIEAARSPQIDLDNDGSGW